MKFLNSKTLPAMALTFLAYAGTAKAEDRMLSLHNVATNESDTVTYYSDGHYLPEGLAEINGLMQDNTAHKPAPLGMNPKLLDALHELKQKLEKDGMQNIVFKVICGYRSPKTNQDLIADKDYPYRKNVKLNSQHTYANAIDFYVEGMTWEQLAETIWRMHKGGVGVYPDDVEKSKLQYVHWDVGPVRHWCYQISGANCKETPAFFYSAALSKPAKHEASEELILAGR